MKGKLGLASAALVIALGWSATNYADHSVPAKLEHHRAWAREHGFPAPSRAIHHAGTVALALGSLALGGLLGRRRVRAAEDEDRA